MTPFSTDGTNTRSTFWPLSDCVVDVKIDFYDGKMHPVDSKDIAFQIAGYFGFKVAFGMARPCLLEPINTVEIRIPEDCMGKVMGDLSSRRGKIQGMDMEGGFQLIKAHVPAWYRKSFNARGFLLFPINVNGKVVAMIYADAMDSAKLRFAPEDLALLKTLRSQAVLAIKLRK